MAKFLFIYLIIFCVPVFADDKFKSPSSEIVKSGAECENILRATVNGEQVWRIRDAASEEGFLRGRFIDVDGETQFYVNTYRSIRNRRGSGASLLRAVQMDYPNTKILGLMAAKNLLNFNRALLENPHGPDFSRVSFIGATNANYKIFTALNPTIRGVALAPPVVTLYPLTAASSRYWLNSDELLQQPHYWRWVRENLSP